MRCMKFLLKKQCNQLYKDIMELFCAMDKLELARPSLWLEVVLILLTEASYLEQLVKCLEKLAISLTKQSQSELAMLKSTMKW